MNKQIKNGLLELGLDQITEEQVEQLGGFLREVLEKNQVMNLTAITDPEEAVGLHLLDSAYVEKFIPKEAETLIDVGTGAGFPGVPVKILRPQLEVTLMDALEKRLLWLEEQGENMNLEQLFTLHGRAEELTRDPSFREVFDVATARAVADLSILSELVLPFVKVGGRFLAMKSIESDEETQKAKEAISLLGGEIVEIHDYVVPQMEVKHRLIVIDKVMETPEKFPRRWAKMKKSPLSIT